MQLYLAAPATARAERDRFAAQLTADGHAVTWATDPAGSDLAGLLAAVEADDAAIRAADVVLTVGDAEDLPDVTLVHLYGVRVEFSGVTA